MARSNLQKLKILYVMDYLLKESDENHPVSTSQIIAELDRRGVAAERKSIYDDLEALRFYGLDIIKTGDGRTARYYIASREFELPELKLLVDSVQSSKFITHKKTAALIRKIEGLASVHEARSLNRQVYVANRIKAMNESVYYNIDEIHAGISENRKLQFRYFEYTVHKERSFRHQGAYYIISPYALTWDNENYYLVGYDSRRQMMKHFRVDKMANISLTEEPRDGREAYEALDMSAYSKKVFGMFGGEEVRVKLRFDNRLVGAVLDRLGRDVMVMVEDETHFTVQADVVVSPQFFAWVCGFGDLAQIVGPDAVVEQMRAHVAAIYHLYAAQT